MNAAARAIAQGVVIANNPANIRRLTISRQFIAILTLSFTIVISALSVITVADNNRIAVGELASLQQTRDDLITTYGQLLLEENTWSSPARVEAIAQQNMGMAQPDPQKVIIIKP